MFPTTPGGEFTYDLSKLTEMPCVQATYCNYGGNVTGPCACTADGCRAADDSQLTVDAALDQNGKELTGTLVYNDDDTVRLTRQ